MILILKDISQHSNRIHIIHPSFIEGTHGAEFTSLCQQLSEKDISSSIICGADCFSRPYYPDLTKLDHYIGIRGLYYCEEEIQSRIKGKTVFFNTPYTTLSSTGIRSKVPEQSMSDIHKKLRDYILENKLYQKVPSII